MNAIEIHDLHYRYKNTQAVNGATFAVAAGTIHGFVGPNGAGKTTTLKIVATLLPAQRGRVVVCGQDLAHSTATVRRKLGFMPDHFSMYRQLTVYEYLDFFAAAYGLDFTARTKIIGDVLALTDMTGRQQDFIRNLSRGMQQRVSLARVLVHDPELLLLDEPASGLDPRARIELMEILQELKRMGKTVFISSHILSELAQLCDAVTIVDRGQVKYTGSLAGLGVRDGETADYVLELATEHAPAADAVRQCPGVVAMTQVPGTARYRVSWVRAQTNANAVVQAAVAAGGTIVALEKDVRHLNEAFMELTQPGVPPVMPGAE